MGKLGACSLVAILALGHGLATPARALATAAERLHALIAEEWQARLEANPLAATDVGRHEWDDRLPPLAMADLERGLATTRSFLARLHEIPRAELGEADRINFDVFAWQLQTRIEEFEVNHFRMEWTTDSGFHTEIVRMAQSMRFRDAADFRIYLKRLGALPTYFRQHIALLRQGLERGMTIPAAVLDNYDVTMSSQLVADPMASPFLEPFKTLPPTIAPAEQAALVAEARAAYRDAVAPAYQELLDFFRQDYRPRARSSLGASAMPEGAAYYRQRIRLFTTLDLTPEQIHEIGSKEVARIRAEMLAIIKEVGFAGDFAAFLDFLRSDPRFYAKTPQELLERASFLAKKMDGQLPALFKTLPRLPYGVEAVPDYLAPVYTAGRYVPAPRGSQQAGTYWVNTYALDKRPFYTLEALTLHEAVPGHHLQGALAQEMTDLPEFRRDLYISAFGEGWALYSERLGLEAGFYTDPYSNFGRLTYEMWRACRLVVDTGIHAQGWTRQQAFDFLASNTALSLHEVGTEIDRYISWPGQALSYKLGEIKIRELRDRAESELGPKFDLREFHDKILENGSIPLSVLEGVIVRYIEAKKQSG